MINNDQTSFLINHCFKNHWLSSLGVFSKAVNEDPVVINRYSLEQSFIPQYYSEKDIISLNTYGGHNYVKYYNLDIDIIRTQINPYDLFYNDGSEEIYEQIQDVISFRFLSYIKKHVDLEECISFFKQYHKEFDGNLFTRNIKFSISDIKTNKTKFNIINFLANIYEKFPPIEHTYHTIIDEHNYDNMFIAVSPEMFLFISKISKDTGFLEYISSSESNTYIAANIKKTPFDKHIKIIVSKHLDSTECYIGDAPLLVLYKDEVETFSECASSSPLAYNPNSYFFSIELKTMFIEEHKKTRIIKVNLQL